jgi:hypothetical protein
MTTYSFNIYEINILRKKGLISHLVLVEQRHVFSELSESGSSIVADFARDGSQLFVLVLENVVVSVVDVVIIFAVVIFDAV